MRFPNRRELLGTGLRGGIAMAALGGFFGKLFGAPAATPTPRIEPKPLTSMAQIDTVIAETGFSGAAAEVRAHCAPCLHLIEAGPASGRAPGVTRLGGSPDLPVGASWPVSGTCPRPSFFGQLNLVDLVGSAVSGQLPKAGLLSFFADLESFDQNPVGVRAVFTPPGVDFAPLAAPAGVEIFRPVAVRFEAGVAFTHFENNWLHDLAKAHPGGDIDALSERLSAAPWPTLGRILGYANWAEHDMREELYFREIGRPGQHRLRIWRTWPEWEQAKQIAHRLANGTIYRPWSAKDDANVGWMIDHATEVARGVGRWQSLLAVESNPAMNLWINDANAIYFFAHADALQNGDFSNVQAVTAQS